MKKLFICCALFCCAVAAFAAPRHQEMYNYLKQQNDLSKPLFTVVTEEDAAADHLLSVLSMVASFPPENKKKFTQYTQSDFRHVSGVELVFLPSADIKSVLGKDGVGAEIFSDGLFSTAIISASDTFKSQMYIFFATDRFQQLDEAEMSAQMAYEIYGHAYPFLFQAGYTNAPAILVEKNALQESINFLNRVLQSPKMQELPPDSIVPLVFLETVKIQQQRLNDL